MNNSKISSLFVIIALFTVACSDDDTTQQSPTTPVSYDDYANLEVGNYWIYERVHRNKMNNSESSIPDIDSMYVSKDTVINNTTYYKLEGIVSFPAPNRPTFKLLRDSLHYLIDQTGKIHFSSQDSLTIFSSEYVEAAGSSAPDTVANLISKMGEMNQTTLTKAGSYQTKSFMEIYNIRERWVRDTSKNYRKTKYAKNIGVVEEYFYPYHSSPNYEVRKLIRYGKN